MAFYEGSVIVVLPMHFSHFLGKVYCEACCGGVKKWDAMFFASISTIKYYHT